LVVVRGPGDFLTSNRGAPNDVFVVGRAPDDVVAIVAAAIDAPDDVLIAMVGASAPNDVLAVAVTAADAPNDVGVVVVVDAPDDILAVSGRALHAPDDVLLRSVLRDAPNRAHLERIGGRVQVAAGQEMVAPQNVAAPQCLHRQLLTGTRRRV